MREIGTVRYLLALVTSQYSNFYGERDCMGMTCYITVHRNCYKILFSNHWQLTFSMAWDWRVSSVPVVSLRTRGLEINFLLSIRMMLSQKCFIMKAKSFWLPSSAFLQYICKTWLFRFRCAAYLSFSYMLFHCLSTFLLSVSPFFMLHWWLSL